MATITRFEDLEIWKIARALSQRVFQITSNEFYRKDFKLKDQMRSAAGSVMDNIAEGFERSSRLEFLNFLSISKGSCGELKSQAYRSSDQHFITENEFGELYNGYDKLAANISGFMSYLNKTDIRGQKFKDRI